MMKIIGTKQSIWVYLIGCTILLKCFILGSGLYTFPDEFRYIASQDAFEALMHGDWHKAVKMMYTVDGRPGTVVLGLIPAGLQILTANFFLLSYNCQAMDYILYGYNLLIYVAILRCIYLLAKNNGLNENQALFAAFVYGCGVNAWIYIRHAFPYDTSLLLILYSCYYLLKNSKMLKLKHAVVLGILLAWSFAVYPGFYLLIMAVALTFAVLVFLNGHFWRLSLAAFASGISVLAMFEWLAKFVGTSYLLEARNLSGTIIFGDFSDTLLFPVKYLWQSDLLVGILIFIGSILGVVYLIRPLVKQPLKEYLASNRNQLLNVIVMGILVVFMLQGPLFGKMVFYGRIFHQFYPFMILVATWWLFKHLQPSRNSVYFALGALVFITHGWNIYRYTKIDYPRDFNRYVNANLPGYSKVQHESEMVIPQKTLTVPHDCFPYNPIKGKNAIDRDSITTLALVNVCYMWLPDLGTVKKEFKPQGKKLYHKPHFTAFYPYLFEGATQEQRVMYEQSQFQMMAISLKP
jgi:hypothetical protein